MEKSLEKIAEADIVVYLFDVNEMDAVELQQVEESLLAQKVNYLLVGNKIDDGEGETAKENFGFTDHAVFISAKDKDNLEVLTERMVDIALQDKMAPENVIVTNARHYHALQEVEKSLADIDSGLENKIPGDLLALDIRRCLHYLGTITGEVTNDDLLDYVFSKFCIGK